MYVKKLKVLKLEALMGVWIGLMLFCTDLCQAYISLRIDSCDGVSEPFPEKITYPSVPFKTVILINVGPGSPELTKDFDGVTTVEYEIADGVNWTEAFDDFSLPPNASYIDPHGFLSVMDRDFYYRFQYCVQDLEPGSIVLRYKSQDCNNENTPCIPKCCPVGMSMDLLLARCRPSGLHGWTPHFYNSYNELSSNELSPHYQLTPLTQTCQVHFFSPALPFNALNFKVHEDGKLFYVSHRRKWEDFGEYCIDGLMNYEPNGTKDYERDEKNQIVFTCIVPEKETSSYMHTVSIIYTICLFIASFFSLLSVIGFLILYQKRLVKNLHGMTVFCLVLSYVFYYLFFGFARLIGLLSLSETRDSWWCYTNGILAHYFGLSSFAWLLMLNLDLWLTFRVLKSHSPNTWNWKRFVYFNAFSWGGPFIVVCVGIILNNQYIERESLVIVPEYGSDLCLIAAYAQGVYHFYIIGLMLAISIVFMIMTIISLTKFTSHKVNLTSNRKKAYNEKVVLFFKLFLVMGVGWVFEFISWALIDDGEDIPIYFVIFDIYNMILAILIFIIFFVNRKTLTQLQQTYGERFKIFGDIVSSGTKSTGMSHSSDDIGARNAQKNANNIPMKWLRKK